MPRHPSLFSGDFLTQLVFDTHSGEDWEWGWETGSYQEPITPHRSLQGWLLSVCGHARVRLSGEFPSVDRSSQILSEPDERRGKNKRGGESW